MPTVARRLAEDEVDDPVPWDEQALLLRELHQHLRQRAEAHIRNVETLMVLRYRDFNHAKCREILKLSTEEYRAVNRWLKDGVAAVTLRRGDR